MHRWIKQIIITALLLSLIVTSVVTVPAVSAGSQNALVATGAASSVPDETQFVIRLGALREKYPHGEKWEGVYYESGRPKAWTCHAYAIQLFCEIFGVKFYEDKYNEERDYTYGTLCAGDIVRIDNESHSIFITKVTKDYIYYTDGNSIGYDVVRWDGRYTVSEMKRIFCYKYHFKGSKLTGTAAPFHTVTYRPNGGSGSVAAAKLYVGQKLNLKKNAFTRKGYTFAGYSVKRLSDGKWYTKGHGWQSIAAVVRGSYVIQTFSAAKSYTFSGAWVSGLSKSTTFVFYAQWLPDESVVEYYENDSGANYLIDPVADNQPASGVSCSGGVYTLSVNAKERVNSLPCLRVAASAPGGAGKEISFDTTLNYGHSDGYSYAGAIGDNRTLTFSFMAKASVEKAVMYIRFNGSSTAHAKKVTITNRWKRCTVTIPKNHNVGRRLLVYFDTKGNYTLNSMILADEKGADRPVAEPAAVVATQRVKRGAKLTKLPVPKRDGYTFVGWFTRAFEGARVTEKTSVTAMRLRLYAHWRKNTSAVPLKTMVFGGHTYELYDNALSRAEAAAFCRKKGGTLVTVTTASEEKAVLRLLEGTGSFCWLGLKYDAAKKVWKWDTGETLSRTRWATGEGGSAKGEIYAALVPTALDGVVKTGQWVDLSVSDNPARYLSKQNSVFICEYPAR